VFEGCGYAYGTWSPDGRWILVMEDVSGQDFTMSAVSAADPNVRMVIAAMIPVNGARSWPGRGDVAWQPGFDLAKEPLPAPGSLDQGVDILGRAGEDDHAVRAGRLPTCPLIAW